MRKDLNDIDQSLRNDVLEAQEKYADLFGRDPYEMGMFFWECIFEQIEEELVNSGFARRVLHDLILNVMGDDSIYEDVHMDYRTGHADAMKEDLTVDDVLAGFGRMTKRIIFSGDIGRIEAIRELLIHQESAVKRVQKVLHKMLLDTDYRMMFQEFIPECRCDPERLDEMIKNITKKVDQRLSAYRKMLKEAADIAKTAMDIEMERGRSYGFK